MKSKFEKLIYKMGVICFIDVVLDSTLKTERNIFKESKSKNISFADDLINFDTTFSYEADTGYMRDENEYKVDVEVWIKRKHFLDFSLRFGRTKEKNTLSLIEVLHSDAKIDVSNYNVLSNVLFKTSWTCKYKKWMNMEFPKWVLEEIDIMYQEQIGRLNSTFKRNRLEQFINNRDVEYVNIDEKQKRVLYLLGNVISDLYQETSDQEEKLSIKDQRKCLELLRNSILPVIGLEKTDEELESIIEKSAVKVNQCIESKGKTLALEDKNGVN